MSDSSKKVEFTNQSSGEKFIHIERPDGSSSFYYGPKDTPDEKKHGHVEYDRHRNITYHRKPSGE